MGYERYPRGTNPQRDYYNRSETQDYGRDYGSGRSGSYSSARQYQAAGEYGDRDDDRFGERNDRDDRYRDYGRDQAGSSQYGQREYGNAGYGQRDSTGYGSRQDRTQNYGSQDHGSSGYGRDDYGTSGRGYGSTGQRDWRGEQSRDRYAQSGNRDREQNRYGAYGAGERERGYGRQPQGYEYDDRGFLARAGDEVRSWFGDEDAERRREADMRNDDRYYGDRAGSDRDRDYSSWRSGQIAALDRDYDEYRSENRSKFHNEFASWRTERQTQRDSLGQVREHMDVVGSDGEAVGTVDKVRGDRILLTKNDAEAGGKHHSIPSRWIQTVDTKVTLSKSAVDAKSAWRDEESKSALFGYGDSTRDDDDRGDGQGRMLNRSFSGTY